MKSSLFGWGMRKENRYPLKAQRDLHPSFLHHPQINGNYKGHEVRQDINRHRPPHRTPAPHHHKKSSRDPKLSRHLWTVLNKNGDISWIIVWTLECKCQQEFLSLKVQGVTSEIVRQDPNFRNYLWQGTPLGEEPWRKYPLWVEWGKVWSWQNKLWVIHYSKIVQPFL